MSLTSIVELAYWLFIKPFGLPHSKCRNCLNNFRTHYPSRTHKRIARLIMKYAIVVFLVFIGSRIYIVFSLVPELTLEIIVILFIITSILFFLSSLFLP